jgi:hypothetical protein
MKKIETFVQRIHTDIPISIQVKRMVVCAVQEMTTLSISSRHIRITGTHIFISCSPYERIIISPHRQKILDSVNVRIGTNNYFTALY